MPLSCGKVFFCSLAEPWDYPSHPKIVVASKDGIIAFVHATTDRALVAKRCMRIEKKKAGEQLITMVRIPAGTCPELSEECWIDCSQATSEEEVLLLADRTFRPTNSSIPATTLAEIRIGILSTHIPTDKVKNMVRQTIRNSANWASPDHDANAERKDP